MTNREYADRYEIENLIRAALTRNSICRPDSQVEPVLIDTGEALEALASIAAELLLLREMTTGKSHTHWFNDAVNRYRAVWVDKAHVQMQRPVAGHC